jgi:heptosyltransferase-2
MKSERRVLVLAPNWLGDAVMALPALADVRRHFPDAELIVGARAPVAPLYGLAPCVDRVLTMQWRGRPLERRTLAHDVAALQEAAIAVAIVLPNSFAAAWLVARARIPERWGYARDLRRPLLTRPVRPPRRSMHQAAYYQHLTRALGIAAGPLEPAIAIPPEIREASRALLMERGWDGGRPLIVIAPGAAYGTAKRWLPEHFGSLVTHTIRQRGAQCVLVGSAADRETARWVCDAVEKDARASLIDLTGATSLETLAGVLSLAAVCVSNDSGAMHVAGAAGVPLAALFGPTREYETAPLSRQGSQSDVLINPVWCRPCMLRECPIDHRCMKGLSPEAVYASVDRLMPRGSR